MVLPATEIYHDISIVLYYICYIILYITYIHIMFFPGLGMWSDCPGLASPPWLSGCLGLIVMCRAFVL